MVQMLTKRSLGQGLGDGGALGLQDSGVVWQVASKINYFVLWFALETWDTRPRSASRRSYPTFQSETVLLNYLLGGGIRRAAE